MATPAPRNFRHKLKFDKSLFRRSRDCFSSGFETEEGCYICWCWTGTICDQTLFSSVSACLTRFGHRWCLFFLGRREPYLQTKEVILPKPTLLTPWAYWNYLRDHKAVVSPKKPTSAWVVIHESCIPTFPAQCAGRSTGLSSSLPLFTVFITLGRGLVNSELFRAS